MTGNGGPDEYTAYYRKSKGRAGISRQRTVTEAHIAALGGVIAAEYTDTDRTAYRRIGEERPERPGFRAALADLAAHPGRRLAAWHADRIVRDGSDTEDLIHAHRGLVVETARGGTYNLGTANGRRNLRNDAADAAYEVDHLVERMDALKAEQAAIGKWSGGPRPFGFEPIPPGPEDPGKYGGLRPRESEAALIRDAAAAVLAGTPLTVIARTWNAAGALTTREGRPWTSQAARRVLLRPRNAGINVWQGSEGVPGQWPAIFGLTTLRALQAVLNSPSRKVTPGPARRWLGGRLFGCGICEQPVRTHSRGHGRMVYVCTGHISRACHPVDEWVRDLMAARLATVPAGQIPSGRPQVDAQALHAQVIVQQERKDELARLMAQGVIDARQLAAGTAEISREIAALNARIASAAGRSVLDGMPPGAEEIRAWLGGLPVERQRLIVAEQFAWVRIGPPNVRGRPRGSRQSDGYFDRSAVLYEWR